MKGFDLCRKLLDEEHNRHQKEIKQNATKKEIDLKIPLCNLNTPYYGVHRDNVRDGWFLNQSRIDSVFYGFHGRGGEVAHFHPLKILLFSKIFYFIFSKY